MFVITSAARDLLFAVFALLPGSAGAFGYSMTSRMIGEVTRAAGAVSGPSTTLIYDDWYPAIRSSEIHGSQMAKAMLLGIPLVLGRTAERELFRHARFLSASRNPAFLWMVRRSAGHLQISRMGIRASLRTMPRNPFAYPNAIPSIPAASTPLHFPAKSAMGTSGSMSHKVGEEDCGPKICRNCPLSLRFPNSASDSVRRI